MRRTWLSASVGVLAATMAASYGCGTTAGNSVVLHVRGTPPPTPSNLLALSHAPVSNPGAIDLYAYPIANISSPVATLASANEAPLALAFDETGRLFGAAGDGRIKVYNPPFSSGENPAFILTTGGGALTFDRAGNLFIGGGDFGASCGRRINLSTPKILLVNAPITGSSKVNLVISEPTVCGGTLVQGLAFDNAGNLWAAIDTRLDEFSPPFTGSSTPVLSVPTCAFTLGFDSEGNMYVGGCGNIVVFRPPFSPSMTEAYTINSAADAASIVFDSAGNLYDRSLVPFSQTNGLQVFSPPFSSTSQPVATISGNFAGVAAGR